MKYIILIATLLISSCGVKNKILKWNNSDQLGIEEQASEVRDSFSTTDAGKLILDRPVVLETKYDESASETTADFNSWFYVIPFLILSLLTFLVFRLKKQNMNSL